MNTLFHKSRILDQHCHLIQAVSDGLVGRKNEAMDLSHPSRWTTLPTKLILVKIQIH